MYPPLSRSFFALCLLLGVVGCAQVPPSNLSADRFEYGQAIAESWKRQTLMNVVRLRFLDAPTFLDVTGVVTADSRSTSVNATTDLTRTPLDGTLGLGSATTWSSSPTITFQPLAGERFSKRIIEPMPPALIFMMLQSGWPVELIMPTMVRSTNGYLGQHFGNPADPHYLEVMQALSEIQRSQAIGFRMKPKDEGEALVMMIHREGQPEIRSAADRTRKLLGLRPDLAEFDVVFGEVPRNDGELALITRSMLEVLLELGSGIEVPSALERNAMPLLPMAQFAEGGFKPLVHIHSGKSAPQDAYTSTFYKGYWYWIDDDDHESKRIFTFLMILFSLADTGQAAAAPIITINSGRR